MPGFREFLESLKRSIQNRAPKTNPQDSPQKPPLKTIPAAYSHGQIPSNRMSPELCEINAREVSAFADWDWYRFRYILILLAMAGRGHYIPAANRPESIALDGLQTTFHELQALSQQRAGRETSRVIFADRKRFNLVISGITHVGTQTSTLMEMTPEPGRENYQIPVLTIHLHPDMITAQGFSDADYISFLTDRRQIGMVVRYKEGAFLALKTTATRTFMAHDTPSLMIAAARKEFLERGRPAISPQQAVLDFNKDVCMEFGLTLYQTSDPRANLARRVAVTA